ncbi:O-antigen ligase family protein [Sutcliffiella horikoshii]|uniref:O-antigen ligase family protein n=1 Tax=Sutcliffiella horikoshii TaxID=79883 RepID=UPI003CE89E77
MLAPSNLINIFIVFLLTSRGLFPGYTVEFILLVILLTLILLKSKKVKFKHNDLMIIGIVILTNVTLAFNIFYAKNIFELLIYMGYYLVGIMIFLIIKFKCLNLINLCSFLKTYIIVTSIICLFTNISFLIYTTTGYSTILIHVGQTVRAVGLFGNPNYYSILLLMVLGFLYGMSNIKLNLNLDKRVYLLLIFNLFLGVFLTFSRGALVAMIIITIIYFFLNLRKYFKFRYISLVSLAFFSLFFLMETIIDTTVFKSIVEQFIIRIENAIYGDGAGRYDIWEVALELFAQNLWITIFGIGGNQFTYYSNHHPHNGYIGTLVESGLVGAILLLILSVFIFTKIFNLPKLKVISPMFYSVIAMYFMALSNDVFIVKEFWIIVGVATIYSNLVRENSNEESRITTSVG